MVCCWCHAGQISNRVLCIVNHILAAAFLRRALVVPPMLPLWEGNDTASLVYDIRVVWDLAHLRKCVGDDHILSLEDFNRLESPPPSSLSTVTGSGPQSANGNDPESDSQGENAAAPSPNGAGAGSGRTGIDLVHCWYGIRHACRFREASAESNCPVQLEPGQGLVPDKKDIVRQLHGALEDSALETTQASAACVPRLASVAQFRKAYGEGKVARARMMLMGDLGNMQLRDISYFLTPNDNPFGTPYSGHDPFSRLPGCPSRALVLPPPAVINRARFLANSLFGDSPYIAFHWRRGDFLSYCKTLRHARGRCTYGPFQAGACVAELLKRYNVTSIFLATNASPPEVCFTGSARWKPNSTVHS